MPARPSPFHLRLGLVAAAGLALRVAYVLALAPRPAEGVPFDSIAERAARFAGDSFFFHTEANLLADGVGFVEPFVFLGSGREIATAAHPPLYPLFLSAVSWLGGTSYLAHQLAGAAIGAAAIVAVGMLARRVAGDRAGLLAAALAAVHPLLIGADGAVLSESLYGLLVTAALLLALRQHAARDRRSALAFGAVVGLAALTRSEALGLLPLLAVPAVLRGRRRLLRLGLAALGCAAAVAPWTARNLAVFDRPVLISHNDSTVLAGANCAPTYGGPDIGRWRFDCISERRTFDEAAQAAIWRREGIDYAREHAGALPRVVAVRVLRTWSLYEPRRQALFFIEGRRQGLEQAGTALYFGLLALALYGAARLRGRPEVLAVLAAPAVLAVAASAVGYGLPRFRHAADLTIVVLAAAAADALLRRRAGRAG